MTVMQAVEAALGAGQVMLNMGALHSFGAMRAIARGTMATWSRSLMAFAEG